VTRRHELAFYNLGSSKLCCSFNFLKLAGTDRTVSVRFVEHEQHLDDRQLT